MIDWLPLYLTFCFATTNPVQPAVHNAEEAVFIEVKQKETRGDPWFGVDKLQHLIISAMLTSWFYVAQHELADRRENSSLYFGGGATFGIGLSKEIYDWKVRKTRMSYKDLIADVLGIGLIIFIVKAT